MKGQIRVNTENIFPIIKKFLYSDHDIFLRELVSNAVDATQKLKTLSSIGEVKGEIGDLDIDVLINKDEKTITIRDRGIGMTEEEVDKYINQVAFSSAEEFLSKYQGQADSAQVIGHFGLGFYSSFMIAERVEILTKSHKDEPACRWICDGSTEFSIEPHEKSERGTDIIMHVNEDNISYLDEFKIKSILERFCRFLPVPIKFNNEQINNTTPAWTKKPSELNEEDYKAFYKELYPFEEPPLFWIHLNVDYPFNLTGILYFPTIKQSYEIQKNKISLYCNQVFVTDEVKDVVPEFLMLLHGVIDSPDIPLNVSRSYLQGDPNVRKINAHITKKVAEKLHEIFKTDRSEFEKKWEHIGLFVKYGMMTDDKFLEKANTFFVMKDAKEDSCFTLEEYKQATEANQVNKDKKHIILYTTDTIKQNSYIHEAQQRGFKVVVMDTLVDAAFISNIELKWEGVQFVRVDADIVDNLIDKQDNTTILLTEEQKEKLNSLFTSQVNTPDIKIELKGLSSESQPVVITRNEMMRRMKDMAMVNPGMSWYAQIPDELQLTVNANHPVYQSILAETDTAIAERKVKNLADLALLAQGMLSGEKLTAFVNRNIELMQQH